jgi:hypothetical protein
VSETSLGDQIILPFETGVINHNQSYTIDPMIYYNPYRIIGNPIHLPSPTPSPININSGSTYDVSFVESGLPSGTPWYVSMGGSTLTSATNTITFSKKVGTYSYSIGSPSGYPSNPSSGNVIVFDSSRSIGIAFSAYPYNVTFDESGLTSGTSWSATLNGNTQSSTTSTIIFSEYYGYYSYNIGSVSGYSNSPSGTGHIMVKEDSAPISVEYTMLPKPHLSDINITQSGLPSGVSWSATLNGNTQSSTTSTITFSEYNGTYSYCIGTVSGYTRTLKSGSITVNGASQSISETYSPIANDVTFFESGLPNGTVWSVNLNGNTISTSSSSISFSEHDGSYSYSIGSMLGYVISPSSGTATINGDSSTVSVTFTRLLGEIGVGYQLYGNTKTQNLLDYITNTSNEGFTYNNAMLGGTLSNITFSIPYFDANMGSGQVNTYTSINNPTVSPDEISGPPQGNSGSPFRGMLIYTLTSSGSVGFPIYCNQNLNGNGVVSFSWTTQPGAYGGFMVELVNNNTYAQSYYKHPFDVYSRLVNSAFSSCIGDSAAYTSIYSSSGVYIGDLVITASEGPSSYDCKYNTYIPFGLTTVFTSPDNNVGSNEYTYGILNYNQYLNYTGTQYGKSNSHGHPVYNPICALNQGSSPSNNTNSSTGIAAEEAIYDLTDNVLLLSTDPCLMAIGLTMVALGPFVFPRTAPSASNSQSYWNKPVSQAGISYGSLPQVDQIEVGCGITLGDPLSYPLFEPMFKILNNGNGNPSYMQFLNMILQQQPISNLTKNDNQFTLDYFTYSASETIVPIIHSYTFHPCVEPCGESSSRTQTYDFTQNDYVVATPNGNGGYTYNGPSYTGAVSLQLYIPLEG